MNTQWFKAKPDSCGVNAPPSPDEAASIEVEVLR